MSMEGGREWPIRSEASLASLPCASSSALPASAAVMIPSPLPRNDKLASLTGPNKAKTHITQCGGGGPWRVHGVGCFGLGGIWHWRRKGGRRGRKNGDRRRHARSSRTQSRRVVGKGRHEGLHFGAGSEAVVFKNLVGSVNAELSFSLSCIHQIRFDVPSHLHWLA